MIRPASADAIAAAADLIRRGEVVAFATETVYGLGADATNPDAVARVFAIKARPSFDPLIVHIDGAEKLSDVAASVPLGARSLIERFWPGPLTVVLPKRDSIPDIVTAGLSSVAVRVPDHAAARALLVAVGRPLAAPSANPFGYVSPTTAAHVETQLGAHVPLILDGGTCRVGVESTVVSFIDAEPTLLRPGGVTLEDVERVIGPLRVAPGRARPLAPGQLPRHYAPCTPLAIVASVDEIPAGARATAALLLPRPQADARGFAAVEVLSTDGVTTTIAANLFAAMRRLDAAGYRQIYALGVPETGLGRAIMDRLRRAAA